MTSPLSSPSSQMSSPAAHRVMNALVVVTASSGASGSPTVCVIACPECQGGQCAVHDHLELAGVESVDAVHPAHVDLAPSPLVGTGVSGEFDAPHTRSATPSMSPAVNIHVSLSHCGCELSELNRRPSTGTPATFEELSFGVRGRHRGGERVFGRCLRGAAEASKQIGAGGVKRVIPVELQLVHE